MGEARSARLPNAILKGECADGLLQVVTVACSSSMSRVWVQGVRVVRERVGAKAQRWIVVDPSNLLA